MLKRRTRLHRDRSLMRLYRKKSVVGVPGYVSFAPGHADHSNRNCLQPITRAASIGQAVAINARHRCGGEGHAHFITNARLGRCLPCNAPGGGGAHCPVGKCTIRFRFLAGQQRQGSVTHPVMCPHALPPAIAPTFEQRHSMALAVLAQCIAQAGADDHGAARKPHQVAAFHW